MERKKENKKRIEGGVKDGGEDEIRSPKGFLCSLYVFPYVSL